VATAQKARAIALANKGMFISARVASRNTHALRNIGACCVRLELLDTKLHPGGWTIGICAPQAQEGGFVPAIGGAPGDHRHGIIDAMVMARPLNEGAMTFLLEDELERWLPLDSVVKLCPIWQETDFFDLRSLFRSLDIDGSGAIDAAELGKLLQRMTGVAPSEEQVAEVLAMADKDGNGLIDFSEFCDKAFFKARLSARLHEIALRGAGRVQALHAGAPWHGMLGSEKGSFTRLVDGTGLEPLFAD